MAISKFPKGISAEILIGGTAAVEHADRDEIQVKHDDPEVAEYQASQTVSNYIESITDQSFVVKLALSPSYSRRMDSKIRFYISVDGKEVWIGTAARPRVQANDGYWEEEVEGVKEGKGHGCTIRKFRFAEIKTNSSTPEFNKVKRLAQRLLPVGTIEIKVYRESYGKQGGETPGTTIGFHNRNEVIPEKALKGEAKSHGTALGNAQKTQRGEVWRTEKKDGEDWPEVIFRFIYRARESLKQMHVIPRTPSRSSSPEENEEDDDTPCVDEFTPAQRREFQALCAKFAQQNKSSSPAVHGSAGKRKFKAQKIKIEPTEKRGSCGGGDRVAKRAKGKQAPVHIDLTGGSESENESEDESENEMFVT